MSIKLQITYVCDLCEASKTVKQETYTPVPGGFIEVQMPDGHLRRHVCSGCGKAIADKFNMMCKDTGS